jgi:hypothetical protein
LHGIEIANLIAHSGTEQIGSHRNEISAPHGKLEKTHPYQAELYMTCFVFHLYYSLQFRKDKKLFGYYLIKYEKTPFRIFIPKSVFEKTYFVFMMLLLYNHFPSILLIVSLLYFLAVYMNIAIQ